MGKEKKVMKFGNQKMGGLGEGGVGEEKYGQRKGLFEIEINGYHLLGFIVLQTMLQVFINDHLMTQGNMCCVVVCALQWLLINNNLTTIVYKNAFQ